MYDVQVSAMGLYLPPKVETAEELAPRIGRSAEWIVRRTGVVERRVSEVGMDEMGARAVRDCLGDRPPPDLLINASGVAHQVLPDSSVYIQQRLGWREVPSFSVHATCLSFIVAVHTAACMIHAGAARRVVVVSADLGTRGRNFDEPESAALLGDGAAAALLEPTEEGGTSRVLGFHMETYSEGADLTTVKGGGTRLHPQDPRTTPADNLFSMRGPAVFKMARKHGGAVINRCLEKAGLRREEVDVWVPHQASGFGVRVYTRYGIPESRIVNIVDRTGNCVAASMPMALAMAWREGRIRRGDKVMVLGTGAGLSLAALALRW